MTKTALRLNGSLWAQILEAVPSELVGTVRDARLSVLNFEKPGTEKLLLRQTINRMLTKLETKKGCRKALWQKAVSVLETHFGYTYGYRLAYHWEARGLIASPVRMAHRP